MERVIVTEKTTKKGWSADYAFENLFPNRLQNQFGKIEQTSDGRFRVIIGRGLKVIFRFEQNARKYILGEIFSCLCDVLMEDTAEAEFIYKDGSQEVNRCIMRG